MQGTSQLLQVWVATAQHITSHEAGAGPERIVDSQGHFNEDLDDRHHEVETMNLDEFLTINL